MPMNHAMGNKRKSAFCRELSVAIRDISRSIEHLRMVRERTMSMTARRQLNESIEQLKMIRAKNRSLFRSKCAVHKKKHHCRCHGPKPRRVMKRHNHW